MKYKLTVGKDRYETLQKKMGDKVSLIREEIESNEHWIHFEIEIDNQFDLLDVFHAGITYGASTMKNAFVR
jgi:hypothetical protein